MWFNLTKQEIKPFYNKRRYQSHESVWHDTDTHQTLDMHLIWSVDATWRLQIKFMDNAMTDWTRGTINCYLHMPILLVANSHYETIFSPCSYLKFIMRKALLFNYKAVISCCQERTENDIEVNEAKEFKSIYKRTVSSCWVLNQL